MNRAGDFDYEKYGHGYVSHRRTDPRIAAYVQDALGSARMVLNVGAGAGSYEPEDRYVIAIEPSATMRAQRPAHLRPAISGIAEALPISDQSVDASMATLTVHQWSNREKGLSELRHVTRGPIVVLTFDGDALDQFWLASYVPELMAADRRRFPAIDTIMAALGNNASVQEIPIPIDCVDGFTEAYYARPERLLEESVRRSQSTWGFVEKEIEGRFVEKLEADFRSGDWDDRFGDWRRKPCFQGALRLITSARAHS